MTPKNNVTRFLDAKGVEYSTHELPGEKMGALQAAAYLEIAAELMYKTIVIKRPGRKNPVLAVVPGTGEVDLKALSRHLGEKKVQTTSQREAEELTGLQSGGISPLALLHKNFSVVVDESALHHAQIYISGGQIGLTIQLAATALIHLTEAKTAQISISLV
ncbi:MAG: Cys-tRNA(Pro) deacylase [Anaerolineae bacterium]|nr:Cys-tRNA(Pro) deacylase [Anaerolineae bacterium]